MDLNAIVKQEWIDECSLALDNFSKTFYLDCAQLCLIKVITNTPQDELEKFDLSIIKMKEFITAKLS